VPLPLYVNLNGVEAVTGEGDGDVENGGKGGSGEE